MNKKNHLSLIHNSHLYACIYLITGVHSGTLQNGVTDEPVAKCKDHTGTIAGAITGALIFITIALVIALFVQRKILRHQYIKSVKVKTGCLKYTLHCKYNNWLVFNFWSSLYIGSSRYITLCYVHVNYIFNFSHLYMTSISWRNLIRFCTGLQFS